MRSETLKALIEAGRVAAEPPLQVPPGPEQAAHIEALRQAIVAESPHAHFSKWNDRQVLVVQPEPPSQGDGVSYSYRYAMSSLYVFFSGSELTLSHHHTSGAEGVPLAGLAQLQRTLAAVCERLLEERRRKQKRDKIRKLKERSIEAQIEALAARHGFVFALDRMHAKVKLTVRLDDQNGLSVDIPHSRAAEIIAGLPAFIGDVRSVCEKHVRFKVIATAHLRFRGPAKASRQA